MEQKEFYEHKNHFVGNSIYHFEWCPKYRYKMFAKPKYKRLCEACIYGAAWRHKIKIRELSVMPDHVHCVASIPPTMSPVRALQLLKGISAYLFFKHHPKARLRYPKGHLWSRGKLGNSVGFADLSTTENYVRTQEAHHGIMPSSAQGSWGL